MAEETFELYSLTSKLTLDTSQFDRAYGQSQSKMRTLAGDVNKLETAVKSGTGTNAGFTSSLQSMMPSLQGLGGPAGAIGIVTVGVGLYAAAIEKASVAVWEITKRFSDAGSELQDMSDQVNFSVETLGTFQGIGKAVGVEVEQLSTGLVTFQKNLVGGNDALKALGVTSKDGEVALRETFKALSEVNDKTLQTALAQEIFGKSGKAMLAIVKETGGDFDAAQEKLRKWNVLMSEDAVAIADQFGDKLGELQLRFMGIGNTIATETAPAFIAAFDQISAALDANETDWRWWGEKLGNIIVNSTALVAGFATAVSKMSALSNPVNFLVDWEAGFWEAKGKMDQRRNELLQGSGGMMGGSTEPRRTVNWSPGGGGGKKTGKSEAEREAEREQRELERLQDQRVDMITRMNMEYKRLTDQLQGVDTATRSYAIAEAQLNGILKDASPELIKQAEAIAKSVDNRAKQLELQNQLAAFMKQQAADIQLAIEGEKNHVESTEDFIKSLERQGAVLQDLTKFWMRFNAVMLDANENQKKLAENIDKTTQAFPLPEIIFPTTPENEIPEKAGEAANREAGLPPEMRESSLLKWRRMVDELSRDITYTIDRAIQRGFEDGIGAGIKEFGLGLLEMARHEALNELQRAIAKALRGGSEEGEGSGGGGGWLSKLVGFGISALGSLFGGGSGAIGGAGSGAAGAIGGNAGGGFVFPNDWSWVGERGPELIKAGPRGASVMSNRESVAQAGGGLYLTQIFQVPDVYAAGNRQTQTQAMRGVQQAATRGYTLRG